MATAAEFRAMRRAIELAAASSLPPGPNPRVGCVLLDADGSVISEGYHLGAGHPHAEVVALEGASGRTRGATAVVTLEPCAHTGRTGPCSQALIDAGVGRVVFGQSDPNPAAAGGGSQLRGVGIEVEAGLLSAEASALNPQWSVAVSRGRPFVTAKVAGTLDGRIAAADGTSRWITGEAAREQVHALRSLVDAVLVGTGTAIADDPALTDRRAQAGRQPRPVVIGLTDLPAHLQLNQRDVIQLRTHDLAEAVSQLFELGDRWLLLEGGPTLTTAMLAAGLVDELIWYVAPTMLGVGKSAIGDLGVSTIAQAQRWEIASLGMVGADARIDLKPKLGGGPGGGG